MARIIQTFQKVCKAFFPSPPRAYPTLRTPVRTPAADKAGRAEARPNPPIGPSAHHGQSLAGYSPAATIFRMASTTTGLSSR